MGCLLDVGTSDQRSVSPQSVAEMEPSRPVANAGTEHPEPDTRRNLAEDEVDDSRWESTEYVAARRRAAVDRRWEWKSWQRSELGTSRSEGRSRLTARRIRQMTALSQSQTVGRSMWRRASLVVEEEGIVCGGERREKRKQEASRSAHQTNTATAPVCCEMIIRLPAGRWLLTDCKPVTQSLRGSCSPRKRHAASCFCASRKAAQMAASQALPAHPPEDLQALRPAQTWGRCARLTAAWAVVCSAEGGSGGGGAVVAGDEACRLRNPCHAQRCHPARDALAARVRQSDDEVSNTARQPFALPADDPTRLIDRPVRLLAVMRDQDCHQMRRLADHPRPSRDTILYAVCTARERISRMPRALPYCHGCREE
ncbi:hypothetical protein M409DRAFT_59092 [Zasmidium cellare ATCC 36951]|uniref:Uncharacterized protein n=1 Tax=Zasmidium cellare ATCC 36951 TaxID=1080233 RepID=A0A6A6C539_ZASCE|nr:uncharacterized protein M409DRAFT_59092 [Zasmidium cellare ATCC 36951]KAF2161378.1 hypothetical protein M409DRAFT_59092 [Zasmidium cellare ATCC 36951]